MDLTASEIRVLGCLIEKQRTTPDTYPLTLNALRIACNQSTARDPVVRYDDETVRDAMNRLHRRRWGRLAGGGRAPKYRHLLDEALTRAPDELAMLCVLMLRGPQTPGELKQRTDRLHHFADLGAIHETLRRLVDRGLVAQLARRPGQKEERYAQLLGDDTDAPAPRHAPDPFAPTAHAAPAPFAPVQHAAAAPHDQDRAAHAPTRSSPTTFAASAPPVPTVGTTSVAGGTSLHDVTPPAVVAVPAAPDPALEQRVAALEAQVASLQAELRTLVDML